MNSGMIEYIAFRLVRKFLIPDWLLDLIGGAVPYYSAGRATFDPRPIADDYVDHATSSGVNLKGMRLLELGAGVTNSAAYELTARENGSVLVYDPFVRPDERLNRLWLDRIARDYRIPQTSLEASVTRISNLSGIADGSIDVVISHCVLEHVTDPADLFRILYRKLVRNGVMLHFVDYRDHFFKYPFHRLLFSRKTWRRWLSPRNLPGWILRDHCDMLIKSGFRVTCTTLSADPDAIDLIRDRISADYNRESPDLAIMTCRITAFKNEGFGIDG
jgi:SAM-dependent methyltransferase